ncbi:MET24 protein, partial [Polypterus senegalus]|nr:methyltransferase-like protein 24 [Polypterus senegalus]MBN3290395.1 MET24 protein [Polypterus senegalus]
MGSGRRMHCAIVRACLLILILFLTLQVFVGILAPGTPRFSEDGVVFTIISIENSWKPKESPIAQSGTGQDTKTWGPEFLEGEHGDAAEYLPHLYQDENENMTRTEEVSNHIELQPWAGGQPSFKAEVDRFLAYITTPQVHCNKALTAGEVREKQVAASTWAICLEAWFLPRVPPKPCVVYSFSMDQKDGLFVSRMAAEGCEVHHFDPSSPSAHSQQESHAHHHRTWLDWREQKPGRRKNNPMKLKTIMQFLGHKKVEYVQADLESAEWKVLENVLLDGTISLIYQLILTVHLGWAGFEVAGAEEEVIRFWYSLLWKLQSVGFQLHHSFRGSGQTVLRHSLTNASSTYTLCWVNTRWS